MRNIFLNATEIGQKNQYISYIANLSCPNCFSPYTSTILLLKTCRKMWVKLHDKIAQSVYNRKKRKYNQNFIIEKQVRFPAGTSSTEKLH